MNKLWIRLTLRFSAVVMLAVFTVALTGISIQWLDYSTYRDRYELNRTLILTDLSKQLTNYYQIHQGWSGSELLISQAQLQGIFARKMPRDSGFFLADADKKLIYHVQTNEVIGHPISSLRYSDLLPLKVSGKVVGYVGLARLMPFPNMENDNPLDSVIFVASVLLRVSLAVAVTSIIFGVMLSRSLTSQLNHFVEVTKHIGQRNFALRMEETGSDELVAVARAFNQMVANLEQAEQLRRNLLTDVAHELRTPLTVLQGNLRAILDEVYPLELEEIARLYEHTRFLNRLVNDLHELAQAESKQLPLHLQETNLNEFLATSIDIFHAAAESKQITLQSQIEPNLPLVMVDMARLKQVLQNLLANALRHTPSGGMITVKAMAQGGHITLMVQDSGEGILPEHLPHVFDRFYRADPARSRDQGGAGLGLAIVRAIVEAHGGQIRAESSGVAGEGTSFMIQLGIRN